MTYRIDNGWVIGDLFGIPVEKMEGPRPGGQPYIRFSETPKCFVYHTTEGTTVAGGVATLRAKFAAPHFVTGENRIVQMRPLWAQAATLRDEDWPGDFHPNAWAFQIETVDKTRYFPWVPAAPTRVPTVAVLAFMNVEYGLPLVNADTTLPRGDRYPKVPGFYGHKDVQENTHGDPGGLKWAELFADAEELIDDMHFDQWYAGVTRKKNKSGPPPVNAPELTHKGYADWDAIFDQMQELADEHLALQAAHDGHEHTVPEGKAPKQTSKPSTV